jgi:hypothetical protein
MPVVSTLIEDVRLVALAAVANVTATGPGGWVVALHTSPDPLDPIQNGRPCVDGATVCYCTGVQRGGVSGPDWQPRFTDSYELVAYLARPAEDVLGRDLHFPIQLLLDRIVPAIAPRFAVSDIAWDKPVALTSAPEYIVYRVRWNTSLFWRPTNG